MQEIHDMVRQDLSREITMTELEKMYDMSSVSINKYFEIMYGDTVKRYMQNKRMQKAAKLLKNSDASIADIALAVGYESQSKFGVIFKRYCGCTPLEYRTCSCLMLKVLGYEDRQINRVMISVYHILVPIGIVIGSVLGVVLCKANFEASVSAYNTYIETVYTPLCFVK